MSKKRMIIFTSVILSVVVISLGIVKLYQTYALGNYIDTASSATFDVNITKDTSVRIPANGYSNVFYMVSNTSPGTVRYGVAYTTDSAVTVKTFSTSKDPASGLIEENGKKYVKLRLENSSSTVKNIKISTILGYTGGGELLPPNGVTLVTDIYSPTPLAQYITGLYTSGTKTAITNNSINYNIVTTQSLINDRLGGTTTDLNGGNIRYYGASPNNYIYFNCEDYRKQTSTTCEVWRIIGVFNGKTKIVKNTSIGNLAWDQDKNDSSSLTTYDDNWSTSTLQKLLNNKYYNGDTTGTVTYYSGISGGTTSSLNMTSIGLKNDASRNMISNVTWNLGGNYNGEEINIYSYLEKIYKYERGTNVSSGVPTTWEGKIALIYPSDFGYAVNLSSKSSSNNWLFNSTNQWTLTPGLNSMVWNVSSGGNAGSTSFYSYNALSVRPTLFLDSGVLLEMGTGTSSNPYRISGGSSTNLDDPIPNYTICYNANGGTGAPSCQTKTHNVDLTLSSTKPTKSGSVFKGWLENGTLYQPGDTYSENKAATFVAQWETIKYDLTITKGTGVATIYYKTGTATNYTSSTTSKTLNLEYGTKYYYYGVPSAGYSMTKCTASSPCSGTLTSNTTVTLTTDGANTYTITLNGNGATTAGSTSTTVKYHDTKLGTITLPKKEYTITYNMNSTGIAQVSAVKVASTFNGWRTASSGGSRVANASTTPVLQSGISNWTDSSGRWTKPSNATLHADWNDSSLLTTLAAITKKGYTCKWNTNSSGTGTSYNSQSSYTPSGNVTLYAVCTPKTYTISYNTGGACNISNTTVSYNSSVVISDGAGCISNGKAISGWTTNSNGTDDGQGWTLGWSGTWVYDNGQYGIADNKLKLYAMWTDVYTISYNANGGSGNMSSHTTWSGKNVNIKLNSFTKTGYSFVGWTTNSDGSDDGHGWTAGWSGTWTYTDGQYGIANKQLKLYARWKNNTYTITYNNNGGSGCSSSKSVTYNSTIGSLCTPTRENYVFLGWFKSNYKDNPLYYYADKYPDLKKAFGYDSDALYKHYLDYGRSEGRRTSQFISSDTYTEPNNLTLYAGWVRFNYINDYYCLDGALTGDYYYLTYCAGTKCYYNRKNCERDISGSLSWSSVKKCNSTTINGTRYTGSDSYYITTCTAAECKYTRKNGSSLSGFIPDRCTLSTESTSTITRYINTTAGLNCRTGPSTNNNVVFAYACGVQIKVKPTPTSDGWYFNPTDNCYVSGNYLSSSKPACASSGSGGGGGGNGNGNVISCTCTSSDRECGTSGSRIKVWCDKTQKKCAWQNAKPNGTFTNSPTNYCQ